MNQKKFFRTRRLPSKKNTDFEEEKLKKRSIFLGVLTLILGAGIIIWGVPLLVRLASFLDNLKSSSQNQDAGKEDQIPPLPPRFSYIPEATNSATISLTGFSEKGSQVKIYVDDELLVETNADEEGEFSVEKIFLNEDKNTIYGIAIDEAGNNSEPSEKATIVFDNQPPQLTIESPADRETLYEPTVEIKGKTDPEAKLTVNDHLVLLESDGAFSYRYELATGGNEINIISQDPAGNKTEKKLTITYHP
jgi:WD40 repeat protein